MKLFRRKHVYQKFNKDYDLIPANNEVLFYKAAILLLSIVLSITYYNAQQVNVVLHKIIELDTMEKIVLVRGELTRITFDRDQNIPTSLNNPGCVRPGNPKIDKLAIGVVDTDSGPFLAFMNPRQGLKALRLVIDQYKDYTLERFIARYAPPKENNTNAYLDHLCKSLKCSPKTLVKDVNQIELCKAISKKEGFKQTKLY